MAKIYSAVCWGGLAGKSVTVNATTDLVTLTDHGLRDGKGVQFASGTLPTVSGTALALNTTYYAKPTPGVTNTFELYYDSALTSKINFTSTGSSLILKSALMLALTAPQLARYGSSGSERIYASMSSASSTRSTNVSPGDEDVIEFLEAFDDVAASSINLAYGPADSSEFTTLVDGVRSEAFHNGIPGGGYTLSGASGCFYHGNINITVDGLEFRRNSATNSGSAYPASLSTIGSVFKNNIVMQTGAGGSIGIYVNGAVQVLNNIVIGFTGDYGGIYIAASGSTVAHNLVTKCSTGFKGASASSASVINNVAVGNTLNWGASPTYSANRFRGNVGQTTDKINVTVTTSTTTMTCATAPSVVANQPVMFETTGTLPTVGGVALDPNKVYFVRSITGSNITIGTAYNGTAVTFNGAGTGTHSMHPVWSTFEPVTAWVDFTDTSLVFVDYTNNDFRPAGSGATPAAQAKMVDYSVVTALVNVATDIIGKERPNYNNGGAEFKDAGPFEYDHGYGPRPASYTLELTGIPAGSEVRCYTGSKGASAVEIGGTETSTGTSFSFTHSSAGVAGFIHVVHPNYAIQEFDYTYLAANTSIPVQMPSDRWYNNP